MPISKEILAWRKKQKRGAIMKPEVFEQIVRTVMKKYGLSRERAMKIAGKIYWQRVKKKFKERKK